MLITIWIAQCRGWSIGWNNSHRLRIYVTGPPSGLQISVLSILIPSPHRINSSSLRKLGAFQPTYVFSRGSSTIYIAQSRRWSIVEKSSHRLRIYVTGPPSDLQISAPCILPFNPPLILFPHRINSSSLRYHRAYYFILNMHFYGAHNHLYSSKL